LAVKPVPDAVLDKNVVEFVAAEIIVEYLPALVIVKPVTLPFTSTEETVKTARVVFAPALTNTVFPVA